MSVSPWRLVPAAVLADAVTGIPALSGAAGEARCTRGGIGERAIATRLAVVNGGAGAISSAEAFAAVVAGLTLGAAGWAGRAGAGAGQATVAGRVAAVATANEAINTG